MHGELGLGEAADRHCLDRPVGPEMPDRPLGDFRASAVRALEWRSYSSLVESTGVRERFCLSLSNPSQLSSRKQKSPPKEVGF